MRGGRYVERRRQSWSAPKARSTKIFRWGAKSVSLLKKTWRFTFFLCWDLKWNNVFFIFRWSILISYWTINKNNQSFQAWLDLTHLSRKQILTALHIFLSLVEPHNKATIRSIQVNYSLNIHAMPIVLVADEIHNKQSNSSLHNFSKSLNPPKHLKFRIPRLSLITRML